MFGKGERGKSLTGLVFFSTGRPLPGTMLVHTELSVEMSGVANGVLSSTYRTLGW